MLDDDYFTRKLKQASAGDPDAAALLWPQVRKLGIKVLNDHYKDLLEDASCYDADDIQMIAAEAFMIALQRYDDSRSRPEWLKYYALIVRKVARSELCGIIESVAGCSSIDAPIAGTDDLTLGDTLEDPSADADPAEAVQNECIHEQLQRMINDLPDQQQLVITETALKQRTLAAVAADMDLSIQRVRSIRASALKSLQKHSAGLFDSVRSGTARKSVYAFISSGTSIVEDIADRREQQMLAEYGRRKDLYNALRNN